MGVCEHGCGCGVIFKASVSTGSPTVQFIFYTMRLFKGDTVTFRSYVAYVVVPFLNSYFVDNRPVDSMYREDGSAVLSYNPSSAGSSIDSMLADASRQLRSCTISLSLRPGRALVTVRPRSFVVPMVVNALKVSVYASVSVFLGYMALSRV